MKIILNALLFLLTTTSILRGQQTLATIENFVDCGRDKMSMQVLGNDLYTIKTTVPAPGAFIFVKLDKKLNTLWEYTLPSDHNLLSHFTLQDTALIYFSKQQYGHEVYMNMLSMKTGKLISTKEIFHLRHGKYLFENKLETQGKVFYVELSENPDRIRDFKNKEDIKIFYSAYDNSTGDVTSGDFSLGVKYFSLFDYGFAGDKVYAAGIESKDGRKTGDIVMYVYNYKTKSLNKVILMQAQGDESKSIASLFTEKGFECIIHTKAGKADVGNFITFNFGTEQSHAYNLKGEKVSESSFTLLDNDKFHGVAYLDQGASIVHVLKVDLQTGNSVGQIDLPIEGKTRVFTVEAPQMLSDDRMLVNVEQSYWNGNNGRYTYRTKEINYYLLDPACNLIKNGVIEKDSYFNGVDRTHEVYDFIGFTCKETSNGIYYFYKNNDGPVAYTLLDNAGNKVKTDVPITQDFNYLRRNFITELGKNTFLFFGAIQQGTLNVLTDNLRGEIIKLD